MVGPKDILADSVEQGGTKRMIYLHEPIIVQPWMDDESVDAVGKYCVTS